MAGKGKCENAYRGNSIVKPVTVKTAGGENPKATVVKGNNGADLRVGKGKK